MSETTHAHAIAHSSLLHHTAISDIGLSEDAAPELARLRRVWGLVAAPLAAAAVGLVVNSHEPQLAVFLAIAALATTLWGRAPVIIGVGLAATMALGVIAHSLTGALVSLIPFTLAVSTAPGRPGVVWIIHTGVCGAASLFAISLLGIWFASPVLGVLVWGALTFAVIALSHRVWRWSLVMRQHD